MAQPAQKPGRSKQDYGTPWEFIRAVEARWGKLYVDLAARADNAKAAEYITPKQDSLSVDWAWFAHAQAWLNPPFAKIGNWAAKCAQVAPEFRQAGGRIFLLTPASIDTDWFAEHVHGKALVLGLRPRMIFDGTPINPKTGKRDPYPKGLMLSVYGERPGFDTWRWK